MSGNIFLKTSLIFAIIIFTCQRSSAQNSSMDFLRYAVEATQNQDHLGAIVLCDRALELNNQNELAWYHRAYNRFLLGDYAGAIEDATHSINLNAKLADTYLLRAEAKLKMGERLSAMNDYNQARRLDSSITFAHFAQLFFRAIL
jgi:tetratricopeptide (TPR) repeat protein